MNESETPNGSNGEVPPEEGKTEVQPEASLADSKALSVPKEVVQAAEAPKISGYVLTSSLGRGAFAQVWKAWQMRTHKWVAVKVFIQRVGVNWLFLQREVERLIRLDKHPNVVSLLDADMEGEVPYYVMDYMAGGSLDKYVDPARPAPPADAARWMKEIAEALSYVHSKGLIHCDLKPANVLLDEEGRVRVADFGQSRIMTESSGALGTLFYMAPEQAVPAEDGGQLQPDVRWDLYGLGTTMHAILTGRVPREETGRPILEKTSSLGERLKVYRELVAKEPLVSCQELTKGKVDEDLSAVVLKCVERDPKDRYLMATGVLSDLDARSRWRPVSGLAHSKTYRLKRYLQRNLALVIVSLAAVSLVSASVVKIVEKNRALTQRVARSYRARAQVFAKKGDTKRAVAYYAESQRLKPSRLARLNILANLERLATPIQIYEHEESLTIAAFSPDAKLFVVGGADGALQVIDVETGDRVGKKIKRAYFGFRTAVFSPDGKTVAFGGVHSKTHAGAAWIVEVGSGKTIVGPIRYEKMVTSVVFSPDGKLLLTASIDSTARLTDARTGEGVGRVMKHGAQIRGAVFSPDGSVIVTTDGQRGLRFWSGTSGEQLGNPQKLSSGGSGNVTMAFTPDSEKLIAGDSERNLAWFDPRRGERIGKPWRTRGRVKTLELSPDGKLLLIVESRRSRNSGPYRDSAYLYHLPTKSYRRAFATPVGISVTAVFSPDGGLVLTSIWSGPAQLRDSSSGRPVGLPMRHRVGVAAAKFSRDGKTVLTRGDDRTVKIWKIPSRPDLLKICDAPKLEARPPSTSVVRRMNVTALAYAPDGSRFFVGYYQRSGKFSVVDRGIGFVYDAVTGKRLAGPFDHGDVIKSARFSPSGNVIMTRGDNGKGVRFWEADTGRPLSGLLNNKELRLRKVLFGDDDRTVFIIDMEGQKHFDIRTGELVKTVPLRWPDGKAYWPWKYTSDGKNLLLTIESQNKYKVVRLMNSDEGKFMGPEIVLEKTYMKEPILSPDGSRLLVAYSVSGSRVWDTRTGRSNSIALSGRGPVIMSPDGKSFVNITFQDGIRLWDMETGRPLGPGRKRGTGLLPKLAFAPDGRGFLAAMIFQRDIKECVGYLDYSWLRDESQSEDVIDRAAVTTGLRIDGMGRTERIPLAEWRRIRRRIASGRR